MKKMVTIGIIYSGLLIIFTLFSILQTGSPYMSRGAVVTSISPTPSFTIAPPVSQTSIIIATTPEIETTVVPTPEEYGDLSITSSPENAQVFCNGQYRGYTPLVIHQLEPSEYQIELKLSGYIFQTFTVVINAGKTTSINANLVKVPVRDVR